MAKHATMNESVIDNSALCAKITSGVESKDAECKTNMPQRNTAERLSFLLTLQDFATFTSVRSF
eukprot:1888863-Amphidinium_carterae.1